MNPDVLDTLVVVFKGDASHYQKTIQEVISLTKSAEQQLSQLTASAAQLRSQLVSVNALTSDIARQVNTASAPATNTGASPVVPSPGGMATAIEDAIQAREAANEAAQAAVDASNTVKQTAIDTAQSVSEETTAAIDSVTGAATAGSNAIDEMSDAERRMQDLMKETRQFLEEREKARVVPTDAANSVEVVDTKFKKLATTLMTVQFWSSAASIVAWGAAASVAAYKLSMWISGLTDARKRAEELNKEISNRRDSDNSAVLSRANSVQGDTRTNYLQVEIARTEQNLRGQAAAAAEAKRQVEQLNTTWRSWTGNKVLDEAKESLKESEGQIKQTQKHLDELRKSLNGDKETEQLKLASDIEQFNKSLEKQIAIFGQAGNAAAVYDLQLRGATDEQVAKAKELDAQLQSMQANKGIDDQIAQWRLQSETVRMTSREVEIYKASLDEATKGRVPELQALDAVLIAQEKAEEQRKRIEQQAQSLADLTQEWKTQAATIGMSAREAEIYRLQIQGIDTSKLEELNRVLTAQEGASALTAGVDSLTNSLREQVETFGMSSTEIELYRLRLQGATEAQLEAAAASAEQLKALTEQQKQQQRANDLIEKHRSPAEKFKTAQAELKELYDKQKIPLEVYNKELQELREKFEKLGDIPEKKSLDTVSASGSGMSAPKSGSQAEFIAKAKWASTFSKKPESPASGETISPVLNATITPISGGASSKSDNGPAIVVGGLLPALNAIVTNTGLIAQQSADGPIEFSVVNL